MVAASAIFDSVSSFMLDGPVVSGKSGSNFWLAVDPQEAVSTRAATVRGRIIFFMLIITVFTLRKYKTGCKDIISCVIKNTGLRDLTNFVFKTKR